MINNLHYIKKKKCLFLFVFLVCACVYEPIYAQNQVTGKVVESSSGNDLQGVNIKIKGRQEATVTDANGNFSIQASGSEVLIVSFVGYVTKEVTVSNQVNLRIALDEDLKALDEVVVIGYGEVSRKDLTGAVGMVNVEEMSIAPVMSFDEALAGRVAGVQVTSGDGQPGSQGIDIVIRGAGSITQDVSPLYVIDGFTVDDFDPASLSMDDIESISVLKDASSTAIYGARGANGVIVIETKKGKVGAPVISYNGTFGLARITKRMEMMNPYDFVRYQIERGGNTAMAVYTPGDLLVDPEFPDLGMREGNTLETYRDIAGINWQEQVFRDGYTGAHTLSIRGGAAQTRYSLSGSIFDQQGVIIESSAKRATARLSIDQTLNKKIKVGVNVSYSSTPSIGQIAAANAATAGHAYGYLMYATWGFRPITGRETLIDDFDEEFLDQDFDEEAGTGSAMTINPVQSLENEDRKSTRVTMNATGYFNYDIRKDLVFRQSFGYNLNDTKGSNFYNTKTNRGSPLISDRGVQASLSFSENVTWKSTSTLNYKKRFAKVHNTNFLLGFEAQEREVESYGYGTQLIPNESLGLSGMDEGLPISTRVTFSNNTLASVFGRANYDYKSRYLLTATYRADGSSKFATGNKWSFFPSGALSWVLSEEEFMKNVPLFLLLKLELVLV